MTSASLTTSESGWEVHAVFTNVAGTATTSAATVTVLKDVAPKVTTQPGNRDREPGVDGVLSAAASGAPTPSVQWQVSTNGGTTWTAVSGATVDDAQLCGHGRRERPEVRSRVHEPGRVGDHEGGHAEDLRGGAGGVSGARGRCRWRRLRW